MSLSELMSTVRSAGIHLEVHGDRLHVDAPRGVITPAFRAALARHKRDLLAVTAPSRGFAPLAPDAVTGFAPTLPIEAIELATNLEARGFQQFLDDDEE